jgi:hypothetical protein
MSTEHFDRWELQLPPIEDVEKSVRIIRSNDSDSKYARDLFISSSNLGDIGLTKAMTQVPRSLFKIASGLIGLMHAASNVGPIGVIEREQSAMPEYMRKDPHEFARDFKDRSDY